MRGFLRAGFVVASVGAASFVWASFDLMLLPGSDGRVYRYDPINRIQLGSFSSSSNNHMLAVDGAGQMFGCQSSGSSIRRYTYSNGELQGILSGQTNTRAINYSSNYVYVQSASGVTRYLSTNGTNGGTEVLSAGTIWRTSAIVGNYLIAVGINASNFITMQSINLTTFATSSIVTTTVTSSLATELGKAAIAVNSANGSTMLAFTYLSGSNLQFGRMSLNTSGELSSGTMSSTTINALNGFSTTSVMPAAVAGHNGMFLYGPDFTSPTTLARIEQFDMFNSLLSNNTTTIAIPGGSFAVNNGNWHPANVVAPEPSTMLMGGVGGLAFLLRRRKR